ncbi:MAG: glycosyltransferase family 2 protein [Pyrinomonadaceae bacterium]|nr:glycosyltransferase family 2 protein [Sphingobacteriaceae bacterium]
MYISVIIPTYNPNIQRLLSTIEGLKQQSIYSNHWELIIVDNNSDNNFKHDIELSWKKDSTIVIEEKQGLTYARMKGFLAAKGDIIILVDDDNILDKDYLKQTWDIFKNHERLGAIGGKSVPQFEHEQPAWLSPFYYSLALRDLGDTIIIENWQNKYPIYAPIGAGMAVRKNALKTYIEKIASGKSIITDRNGSSLSSGGDNDIVLEIIKSGWQTAYFPNLTLKHIIPGERLKVKYVAKLSKELNKSWVKLLESHNINPWNKIPGWTVSLRKVKAWFVYKAWKNSANYIKWKGACGTFEGLAD